MDKLEYIDRTALIERIKTIYCAGCDNYNKVCCRDCLISDALDYIADAPAADVAPVVHGEWLDCECHNDIVQCSVCSDIYNRSFVRGHKYCNCGAKMDEEETHG